MTIDLDKLEAMARKASQGEWVFYMPNPAAILALIAEVRALREDAERWRKWLPWMRRLNKKPFDLAVLIDNIDAARKEEA